MELVISFLQQHAIYLLAMVTVQVVLGTAAHWSTKERGWDDTWIGAIGLAIVFGGPSVALWLAGLDFRVPLAMFVQGVVIVGIVKFTEWARRRDIVDIALFVLQTLMCLVPPALLATWLVLAPPSWVGLLKSLGFVVVSIVVVGLTTLAWDWHHHTIQGYPIRGRKKLDGSNPQVHDIRYVLERQADLIRELMDSNATIDGLAITLRQQQEIIAFNLDQLEKWGRVGKQTLDDILRGIPSNYVLREKAEEKEEEAEVVEGSNNNNGGPRLRIVGRREE